MFCPCSVHSPSLNFPIYLIRKKTNSSKHRRRISFWRKLNLGGLPQTPKERGNDMSIKDTNRTRRNMIMFRVTDLEKEAISERMKVCGIWNRARYLRTMAINGCIIKPDYSAIKQTNVELHKIGVNLNQIAKKVNETGNIHANEVQSIQSCLTTCQC